MTTKASQPRVMIFDTTLRDGEQSPGATMTHEEKLEIAGLLDEMGVDIIEAGFPIASEGDFHAVAEISKRAKNSTICGLARASYKDIDRCWEAVKHARSPRIHTFIGTSPLHRAIPNLTMDEMAQRIEDVWLSRAKSQHLGKPSTITYRRKEIEFFIGAMSAINEILPRDDDRLSDYVPPRWVINPMTGDNIVKER